MRYKVLDETICNLDEFSRVLSDVKVSDDILLSELDRLYAEWKSEDDFYFFVEEEYSELERLRTATGVTEFFRQLIGDTHRGVALLGKGKKEIPPLLKQVQAALLRRQLGK
jgi:hypothetical protein